MSRYTHNYDFEHKGKNLLKRGAAVLAFAAVTYLIVDNWPASNDTANNNPEPSRKEEPSKAYYDGVDHQMVTTLFLQSDPERATFTWNESINVMVSEEVKGHFPTDQAFKLNIAVYHAERRRESALITLTSAKDDLVRRGPNGELEVSVPQSAKRTTFADLDPATREDLRLRYLMMQSLPEFSTMHRNSLPAGLVDTAAYPEPSAHGYSVQFWNNRANGPTERDYYRDVEGILEKGEWIQGRKMVTDYVIREEGKVGHVRAEFEPHQFENWPDINDTKYFRSIGDMTPQEREEYKAEAATYGVYLADEVIHSYVRDKNGVVIAKDDTRTFVQTKKYEAFEQHTYMFVDLSGDDKMIRQIASLTLPVPLPEYLAGENGPALVEGADGTVTIGGHVAIVKRSYVGYDIENIDNRFKTHGKESQLPARARDYYPLGRG